MVDHTDFALDLGRDMDVPIIVIPFRYVFFCVSLAMERSSESWVCGPLLNTASCSCEVLSPRRGETVSVRNDADPYLVNVCDDPLLSGCLMYALPRGRVVRMGSSATCAIRIDGLGIQPETCSIVCHDGRFVKAEGVHLILC